MLTTPSVAWAQSQFPTKAITIVVASGAGGGTDIMARIVADKMRDDLGQSVIVDNRPGAGGNIGADLVARAPKDGYTLLMTAGALAIAPSIYASLSYDPLKDLTGVAWLAIAPLVVVTKPDGPLKSIADLVDLAKRNGGRVSFASFGAGTPSHLAGESINLNAKVNMTHVPYNRGGAIIDIQAGDVTVGILDALSTIPYIKSGQLRALAVTGPKRFQSLPDVPTLAEAGIPFTTVGWHGAFAPTGTPKPVIDRLNAAFTKALAQPGVSEKIIAGGSLPIEPPVTADEWNQQFRKDVQSWAELVKAANIKIE
ncbi:MAG: Bug family tripartite tricarboxylate transporter substrate binding protein [Afipia sp.]